MALSALGGERHVKAVLAVRVFELLSTDLPFLVGAQEPCMEVELVALQANGRFVRGEQIIRNRTVGRVAEAADLLPGFARHGLVGRSQVVQPARLDRVARAAQIGPQVQVHGVEELVGRDFTFALRCLGDEIPVDQPLARELLTRATEELLHHEGPGRFGVYRDILRDRLRGLAKTPHEDTLAAVLLAASTAATSDWVMVAALLVAKVLFGKAEARWGIAVACAAIMGGALLAARDLLFGGKAGAKT